MSVECSVIVDGEGHRERLWFRSAPRIGEVMMLADHRSAIIHAVIHYPSPNGVTNTPPKIELRVTPQATPSAAPGLL